MTSDLDIYRSAQALVKQHGEDAPIHAAMKADAMLETGDLDGYAVWKRIVKAVEELQRVEPGAQVHLAPFSWRGFSLRRTAPQQPPPSGKQQEGRNPKKARF